MDEPSFYKRHLSDCKRERGFLSATGFTVDDYWDKQGRKSVDAVAIFGGLLGMGVAGRSALNELGLLPKWLARFA